MLRDLEIPRDRDAAHVAEIVSSDDGDHTRHRPCDLGVDCADARMGIRAVQKRDFRQIGDDQVVEVLPRPNQETMILHSPLATTDQCATTHMGLDVHGSLLIRYHRRALPPPLNC
jgi:hypothetical protein